MIITIDRTPKKIKMKICKLKYKYEIIAHESYEYEYDLYGNIAEYCTVKLPNIKYICEITFNRYNYESNDLLLEINNITYNQLKDSETITNFNKYQKKVRINYYNMKQDILIHGNMGKHLFIYIKMIENNCYNYYLY